FCIARQPMNNETNEQLCATPPAFEENSQLKPYDYKVGGLDNDGLKVIKIYTKFPGYVIYRTENAIRIDINDKHPDKEKYLECHYRIGMPLARMYSLLPENLSTTESINRLVARAMTLNVGGHVEDAKAVLKHAESRLVKLKTVEGRLQYSLSAFCLVLLAFLVSQFDFLGSRQILAQVIACGALGGLLSIVVGYKTLTIDVDADLTTNRLVGGSRIVIAAIASLFVYFAIKANVAFSFVKDQPDQYGIFMFAMVAGFIEMLVPNIMNNLAKDAKVSAEGTAERNNDSESEARNANKVRESGDSGAATPQDELHK
ncbi:hypothetical protein, partial [Pseudoduganella sp. RAF53_2]